MRRMMALSMSVVLAGLAAACGGDDESDPSASNADDSGTPADRQDYVDAIGETLTLLGVPEDGSACAAEVYIEVIGMEQLAAATTPDQIRQHANLANLGVELDEADGDAFYAGVNECFDVRRFFLGLASGGDDTVRACLDQAIGDDALQQAFVGGLLLGGQSTNAEIEATMTRAYTQCAPQQPDP